MPLLENSKGYTTKITKEYKSRRNIVAEGLNKMPTVLLAQGAFIRPWTARKRRGRFCTVYDNNSAKGKTVMVTPMQDFLLPQEGQK